MKFVHPATIEQEEAGCYLVGFRDLEEAVADGEIMEEAPFNAPGRT